MPDLTPTEELIIDVLVARHRLGEPFWPIAKRNRKALDSLVAQGLVTYFDGWTPQDLRAHLTPAGIDAHVDATYVAPALDPQCRASYFGPLTSGYRVRCERRSGHGKKHRYTYGTGDNTAAPRRKAQNGATSTTKDKSTSSAVRWTDAEAAQAADAYVVWLRGEDS